MWRPFLPENAAVALLGGRCSLSGCSTHAVCGPPKLADPSSSTLLRAPESSAVPLRAAGAPARSRARLCCDQTPAPAPPSRSLGFSMPRGRFIATNEVALRGPSVPRTSLLVRISGPPREMGDLRLALGSGGGPCTRLVSGRFLSAPQAMSVLVRVCIKC